MISGNGSAARLEPFRRTPPGQKQQSWVEDQEMIPLRLIVPAVLAASAATGCISYFVTPLAQVETDERLPPTLPNVISPTAGASTSIERTSEEEKAAAAFQQAAEAILRRAPNTRASDQPPITGHIPLPRRRPIPR